MLSQNKFSRKAKLLKQANIIHLNFVLVFNISALQADIKTNPLTSEQSLNHSSSSGMIKIGLTDIPEKENFSLEYFIKEKAYLKLVEKDILPYIKRKNIKPLTCFISYAWGEPYHEFWVKRFCEMLHKAGIQVLLDRWVIKKGNILNEFVRKIEEVDWVIVVGTKLYLEKYSKRAASAKEKEHVARLEGQLIEYLVRYSTERGNKVVPILLEGTAEESLPFMLRHKIASEFTKNDYFEELLKFIHDLYNIDSRDKHFEEIIEKFRKYAIVAGEHITEAERKAYEKKRKEEVLALDNEIFKDIDSYKKEAFKISGEDFQSEADCIRSDLIIPKEIILLNRQELLTELSDKLTGEGIQSVALVGVGGAGKTTLARQYARSHKFPIIWEINAETHETLVGSFEKLACALSKTEEEKKILAGIQGMKNQEEREDKIIQLVKGHLRTQSNWLLIYDNVETFNDIQKYFPQDRAIWNQGKIILTTRDSHIQYNNQVAHTVQIGELNVEQKLKLFIKVMSHGGKFPLSPERMEEAKKFLEEIPPFPLDVSISAYYLKATNIPYATYLKNLAQHNNDFVVVQEKLLQEVGGYTRTRYGIITLSLQHIISVHKDFEELLLFISLLDSQNIPRDLLEKHKGNVIVDNFIYNLKKYSLVTTVLSSSLLQLTFSIHRSTQEISLSYLTKILDLEKDKHFIEQIGKTFKNYVAETIDKEDFPKMSLLARHCEVLLSHPYLLTDFVIASIGSELGSIYRWQGNFAKAKQFLKKSIVIYRKHSYKNHVWVAQILTILGNVYREQGHYEEAKRSLEKSLVIYKKNSYENHPWFAQVLAELGGVYREQGHYEKAKQALEKSLVIYKKDPSKNQLGLARALRRLGGVYKYLGYYERAKQLIEESLVIYRKNFDENQPWLAWGLVWLGSVYRCLGHYEKAKQLLEEGLAIYRKNFDENQPWVGWTLRELGSVHSEQGNYMQAKDLLNHSLQIYERIYGKDHLDLAPAIMNFGRVYLLENNIQTAEDLILKALKIFQQNNHPEQYMCLESLSDLLLKKATQLNNKGDTKQSENFKMQAIDYLTQALKVIKTYFPKDSHHIIRIEAKIKHLIEN